MPISLLADFSAVAPGSIRPMLKLTNFMAITLDPSEPPGLKTN